MRGGRSEEQIRRSTRHLGRSEGQVRRSEGHLGRSEGRFRRSEEHLSRSEVHFDRCETGYAALGILEVPRNTVLVAHRRPRRRAAQARRVPRMDSRAGNGGPALGMTGGGRDAQGLHPMLNADRHGSLSLPFSSGCPTGTAAKRAVPRSRRRACTAQPKASGNQRRSPRVLSEPPRAAGDAARVQRGSLTPGYRCGRGSQGRGSGRKRRRGPLHADRKSQRQSA